MLPILQESDWQHAFQEASCDIRPALPNDDVSLKPFTVADVAKIIAYSEGENDGQNWLMLVKLNDGRFAFIDAGCDYTGWDCQAGGTATITKTLLKMKKFGLSDNEKERLGL